MSNNPPQLRLSLPPSGTSAFKRSFAHLGWELDSPPDTNPHSPHSNSHSLSSHSNSPHSHSSLSPHAHTHLHPYHPPHGMPPPEEETPEDEHNRRSKRARSEGSFSESSGSTSSSAAMSQGGIGSSGLASSSTSGFASSSSWGASSSPVGGPFENISAGTPSDIGVEIEVEGGVTLSLDVGVVEEEGEGEQEVPVEGESEEERAVLAALTAVISPGSVVSPSSASTMEPTTATAAQPPRLPTPEIEDIEMEYVLLHPGGGEGEEGSLVGIPEGFMLQSLDQVEEAERGRAELPTTSPAPHYVVPLPAIIEGGGGGEAAGGGEEDPMVQYVRSMHRFEEFEEQIGILRAPVEPSAVPLSSSSVQAPAPVSTSVPPTSSTSAASSSSSPSSSSTLPSQPEEQDEPETFFQLSTLSSLSSSTPSLSLTLPGPSLQPQPSSSTRFPYPRRSPSRTDDRRPSRPPQRIATPMHHNHSSPPVLPPLAIGRVVVDLTRGGEHEEGAVEVEVPSSASIREQGRERNDSWTSSTSLGVSNLTRTEAPQHTTPLNPDWTAMFHPFEGFDLGPASGSGSTSTSSASGSGSGSASTGAQRPYLGVDDESLQRQQQNYEEEDEESDDMNTMEPDDPDQDDQEDDEEEEEQEEEEDEDEDEDAETYYSFAEDVELPGMDLDLGLGLGLGQTIIGGEEAAGGVVVSEEEEEEDEDEEVIVFTGSGAERNRAGGEEEEEAGDEQHEDDDEENDGEGEEQTPTTALQADYAGFRERLDSALERLRSPSPLVPEFAGSVSGGVGGSSGGLHRLPTPSIPSPPLEFAYRSQLPTLPIPPSHLELAHASRSRARPTPTIPPPRLELAYGSRRGAGPAPSSSNGFGSSSANEFNYGFNGSFSGRLSGSGSSSFNESGSTSSNSNTHIPSFGTALREIQREDTRERETAQFLAALFGAATEEAEGDRGEEERRSDGGGRLNEHARPFSSLSGTHETDVPATNHQGSQAYLNRNETLAQRTTRARISNAATLNDNASLMASIERQVSQATAVLSAQARAARAPDSGYRHLPAPRMRPPPSDGGWNAYSDMAERRRNEARQRELARAIVRERERQREGERGREAEMQSQREAEMQNQRERARNLPMSFNLRESENSVPARRNFFDPTPVPGSLVRRMQTGLSSTNSTSTSASASASASGVNPGATQPQIQRRVISADQRAALMAGAWDDSRITVTRIADGSGTSRAPSGPPTLPPLAMDSISSDDEYDGWIRDLELRRRSRAVARLSADADASVTRNTERGPNSGDGSMHGGINATDNNASMVSAGSSTNSGTSTNPPATFSSSSSSVPIRVDHTPPSPLLTELHQLLAPSSSSATTTTTTNVNNASSNSFTPTHRATSHDMSYFPIPRSNPPQINPNSFSWEREPPVDRAFQAILNYEGNGTFTVTPMEIESPPPPPQQQQSQSQPRPQVQPQQQRARPTMPRTQTSSEWTRIGNEWGPVGSFGRAEEENQVQSDRDQTVANSQSNDSPAPYVPPHLLSLGLRRQQTDSSSGSSESSSLIGNSNTSDRMVDEVRGANQRQNAHFQIMQEAMMRHQTTSLRGMQETRNQEQHQRMASLRAQRSVWDAREDDEDATALSSSGGPERATARGNRLPLESATRLQTQEQAESTSELTSWMVRPTPSESSSASTPRPLPLLSRPTPPRIRTNSSSSSSSGIDHPLFPPRPRRLRPQASTSLVGENASEIRNLSIREDMRRQLQNQRLADDLDLIAMHRHQHNVRQVHRLSRERESDVSSRAAAPQQHVRDARSPTRPVVRPRLHLPPPTQRVRPSSPPRIGYRLVPGSENAQRQRDQPSFRPPPFARYNNPIPSSPEHHEFGDLESSDEDWDLRRTQNNAPSLPSPDLGGWNDPMMGHEIFEDNPMETTPQDPRSDARMGGLFDPPSGGGWMDTTSDDQSSNAARTFMQWEEHSPPPAPESLPTASDSNTFAGLNPDMFADGPFRNTIRTMAEARRRRELREQVQMQSHSTAPSGSSQRAADPPSLPPLSLGDSDFSFRIQPSRPHTTSNRMENSQVYSDPFFRRTNTSFTPEQVENLPRANGGARLHPQHHRFLGNHRAAVNARSNSTEHSAQPRTRGATEGFSHAIEVLRGDGLSGPRAEQMINRFMDDHDPVDSGWDVSYNTIGANFTRRENPAEEGTPEEVGRGRLRANRSRPRPNVDALGMPGFRRRRALGDYMRDEDFDTSYEGLLTLAATLGEVKPKATPGEVLATLETGLYKDWATPDCDKRCPICLDDYESTSTVLKLRECSHWMHRDCLQQWLGTANTCPVCRKPVSNQSAPRARPRYTGFRFRPPPDQPGSTLRRFPRDPPGPGDPGFGPSGNLPLPSFPPWG